MSVWPLCPQWLCLPLFFRSLPENQTLVNVGIALIVDWKHGDIQQLVTEGGSIQQHLKKRRNLPKERDDDDQRLFARFMLQGRISEAIKIICGESKGGSFSIDAKTLDQHGLPISVRDQLKVKHPPRQPPFSSTLLSSSDPVSEPHPVIFSCNDGQLIHSTSMHISGSAGPSGLDAFVWRRLCTMFDGASDGLCHSLALVTKRLCTEFVDPVGVAPLLACRLIALDKNPGVRPIGVGEVVRRLISKAVLTVLRFDILEAAGCLQLCAGQDAGCEAAVHAMHELFPDDDSEAILLVDADNAFNSLNRQSGLRNVLHLYPSLPKILINSYREDSRLFIDGESIFSREGTTQGDPLAMSMYAIGIIPLINRLSTSAAKQTWYAYYAAACGAIEQLRAWWDQLNDLGPNYGYFFNPTKTWLIVKEQHQAKAECLFENSGIHITTDGRQYLGSALGTLPFSRKICLCKGRRMEIINSEVVFNSKGTASCCLLGLYPWFLQQMGLHSTYHSRYFRSVTTT